MSAWQLPDDYPKLAWWLPDDFWTTARLYNDCLTTVQRLPHDCLMTVRRLLNNWPMTARGLPYYCSIYFVWDDRWISMKTLNFDSRYLKKCPRFVFIWNNWIFIGQHYFVCIQYCHFLIVPSLLDFDNCCRNSFISYDNRYSCYFVCTFGSIKPTYSYKKSLDHLISSYDPPFILLYNRGCSWIKWTFKNSFIFNDYRHTYYFALLAQ